MAKKTISELLDELVEAVEAQVTAAEIGTAKQWEEAKLSQAEARARVNRRVNQMNRELTELKEQIRAGT